MSFFFFKIKPSLSLIFDIRDASVSLAVARFEVGKIPEMILCQNFPLKKNNPKDHEKYIASMIETLDTVTLSVRKQLVKIGNKEKIDSHYFFIGSPWSISQSKVIKITKDKPFEITNSFIEKILLGEEVSIEKNLEEQTQESNWKILEEKIIQSKLNGFKVENFFGKKVRSVVMEVFVSFIPDSLKEKITAYSNEKFDKNNKRQNHSCIMSSYSFLRDLYSDKNDFVYIDLGRLITDIYVVRDDVVFGIASFPFGEENIIETSLLKTNLAKDVFLSHINIGQDNKFDLDSHNNGEDLLKPGFDAWKLKFDDSLSQLCTEVNIPNRMFIIANSTISNMLAKELPSDKNNFFEMLGSMIEISVIGENVINNFILNGKVYSNEPYVKMDIVFLDKMIKNNFK